MRCLSCNSILSDLDTTRKAPSGFYLDLCSRCFYLSDFYGNADDLDSGIDNSDPDTLDTGDTMEYSEDVTIDFWEERN